MSPPDLRLGGTGGALARTCQETLLEVDQGGTTMRVSSSKSFLFASAAGLIAVSGAQAAEPVKAKPVQYVRICPTYGDGFYYIPGTDTCIKVGGYIRSDFGFNEDGGRTPLYAGTLGAGDRTVSQFTTRHRA